VLLLLLVGAHSCLLVLVLLLQVLVVGGLHSLLLCVHLLLLVAPLPLLLLHASTLLLLLAPRALVCFACEELCCRGFCPAAAAQLLLGAWFPPSCLSTRTSSTTLPGATARSHIVHLLLGFYCRL
jgi:hypothetical protein